jgi:hypothetical protein
MICPVCVAAASAPKPAPKPKAPKPKMSDAPWTKTVASETAVPLSPAAPQPAPLTMLTLHVNIDASQTPADGSWSYISIRGVTAESLATDQWITEYWDTSEGYSSSDAITAFSEWVRELSAKYIMMWRFSSASIPPDFARYWMIYLYNKYGPADKIVIDF